MDAQEKQVVYVTPDQCVSEMNCIKKAMADNHTEIKTILDGINKRLFVDNGTTCVQTKLDRHERIISCLVWFVAAVSVVSIGAMVTFVLRILAHVSKVAAVMILVSGCTSTRIAVENSNGSKWAVSRLSVCQRVEAPNITVDGLGQLTGYSNDGGTAALNAVIEAAVAGALKGVR